jgi:kynureninase
MEENIIFNNQQIDNRRYVLELDKKDPLSKYIDLFIINDPYQCYLNGNSLGRLPKATIQNINNFMINEWGKELVTGWKHWIHEARLVGNLLGLSALGASEDQVLVTDNTSINFYQLALAAIQARPHRKTIITDLSNFPTDMYILQGLVRQFDLKLIIIDNKNSDEIKYERITPNILEKYMNDEVVLVTFQVIQYRSGARLPMKEINDLVNSYGAYMLWDASHAIGIIEMNFDKDNIDLAVGCTYKYGNSGPGSPGWLYVSKKIQKELQVPIQGWFAQVNQFKMEPTFQRDLESIRGFQVASPNLLGLICVKTSFTMIKKATITEINNKRIKGTNIMITLYNLWFLPLGFELKTPIDEDERGGHIILCHTYAKEIVDTLINKMNVIVDYREPNSIRIAFSPLYNSFVELWDGLFRLKCLVESKKYLEINK